MILDGEIVAFDANGKPSFGALQERAQLKAERDIAAADRNTPVVFVAFDLLHFAGINLRRAPYSDRRRYLAQCLLPSPLVQLVHAAEDGIALHAAALASGFEGVVGKRKQSRYEAGRRSASWLKVKPTRSADFVVGGYTKGKGARAPLGAILVGYWDNGRLRYASHVGSGFDERTLAQVKARLDPLQRKTWPFAEKPELNAPDDLGRACHRRRSELPELDRRRSSARAGVPAAAGRHRSEGGAAERARPHAGRGRIDHATRERSNRRHRGAAGKQEKRVHARRWTAPDSPHQPRARLLAGRSGAEAAGADQARPAAFTWRRFLPTCCRTLPTARSR